MAHVAERNGMIPGLREFQTSGAPIWGTCAGLIFLADRALGQKMGGQALLGGLDCTVHRNFFGSQINSFETSLPPPALFSTLGAEREEAKGSGSDSAAEPGKEPPREASNASGGPSAAPFRAVFIRAPAIIETGPQVEVLAEYRVREAGAPEAAADGEAGSATKEEAQLAKLETVAVAVKQRQLLATAFHPELTSDLRWHQLFLQMVLERVQEDPNPKNLAATDVKGSVALTPPGPGDLPVYGSSQSLSVELKY